MHVKMLDGRFKGEIRDLRNDVAVELLRAGRAARPYDDPPAQAAAEAETPALKAAAPVTAKKKASR